MFKFKFFDYLLESDEVDARQNHINVGACPHVNVEKDDDFIAKTTVHGIHAIVAWVTSSF